MSSNEKIKNTREEIVDGGEAHPLEEADSFEEHMRKDIKGRRKKTVGEKAKEKGYYKKEDGTWWQAYDDSFEEEVEWFKLDEEYPDLAERTEELAEKYHIDYNDYSGLKEYVYKNAANLEEASDEHLENIFMITGAISHSTAGTEELLVGYDSDKLDAICDSLGSFYSRVVDLMPEHKLDRRIMGIGECFVRNYNEKLVSV